MKTLILILLFLSCSFFAPAQQYSIVLTSDTAFYTVSFYTGYYSTWDVSSPIKATLFDSSVTVSNGVEYYNFYTYKDTALWGFNSCLLQNGSSWIGQKILSRNDAVEVVLTADSDSVYFHPQAALNDSWKFYTDTSGIYFMATVTGMQQVNIAGISDSMQIISLQAYDALNNPMAHQFNQKEIWISKQNGFLKVYPLANFPYDTLTLTRVNVSIPTWAEIYDFEVGDEFESSSWCSNMWGQTNGYSYSYVKILGKIPSVTGDSVWYIRLTNTETYQGPPIDSSFTSVVDTVLFRNLHQFVYTTLPEENTFDTLSWPGLLTYKLINDPKVVCGRLTVSTTGGNIGYNFQDSCFAANHFEPIVSTVMYSVGLGESFYEDDRRSQAMGQCSGGIFWYHKGSTTCGTYRVIDGMKDYSATSFSIYPNPCSNSVTIDASANVKSFQIINALGKVMMEGKLAEGNSIDVQHLPAGMYILNCITNHGAEQVKLLKQ